MQKCESADRTATGSSRPNNTMFDDSPSVRHRMITRYSPPMDTLPTTEKQSCWNSLIAGYMAGVSGTLVGYPLDSAKVWMQTSATKTATPSATLAPTTPAGVPPKHGEWNLLHSTSTRRPFSSLSALPGGVASPALPAPPPTLSRLRVVLSSFAKHVHLLRSLYSGVATPLLTVGMIQAAHYGIYDAVRYRLHSHPAHHHHHPSASSSPNMASADWRHCDSLWGVALASVTAGSLLACVTSPLLVLKTQQQLQPGLSWMSALKATTTTTTTTATTTASTRSFHLLFTGFAPHLFVEVVGRGIYFVVYEGLKRYLSSTTTSNINRIHASRGNNPTKNLRNDWSSNNTTTTNDLYNNNKNTNDSPPDGVAAVTLPVRMVSAAAAGIFCAGIIFPMDAVRCRMYAAVAAATAAAAAAETAPTRPPPQSILIIQCQCLYREGGYKAFYRGFGVTVLRAGPVAAAVMPIYDLTVECLNQRNV